MEHRPVKNASMLKLVMVLVELYADRIFILAVGRELRFVTGGNRRLGVYKGTEGGVVVGLFQGWRSCIFGL